MQRQSLQSQKGEIEFRKQLVSQQVDGKTLFNGELSAQEMKKILLVRMENTRSRMKQLQARDMRLSPYIELGAERGQRAMVMENDVNAHGAAIDLSYDMLKSGDHYQKVFDKAKCALRICCDIHTLPFLSNTVPFIFCYQFLHHFPDPSMVLREVRRVLSDGGHFFFDEEPYKKVFHLNLYDRKIDAREMTSAGRVKKWIDYLFAREVYNEENFGIVENDAISIGTWKRAFREFKTREVTVRTLHNICSDVFSPASKLKYLIAWLGGGVISGICQKDGKSGSDFKRVEDLLACPSCLKESREQKLERRNTFYACTSCGKKYPVKDDIAFLFLHEKLRELYPEEFKKISN